MKTKYCEKCGHKFDSLFDDDLFCEPCMATIEDADMEAEWEADSGVFCGSCGLMVQEVKDGKCRACVGKKT